jgi:hypothetical protein
MPAGGEELDSPASADEEDVEGEDSDSEDQDPKYQEEEPDDDAALSEEDHDDPGEQKGEGGSEKPPKAKVGKPAWSARPYRAKQWVDDLKLRLGEGGMWCYLEKKGNLNLCTINVNGNPMKINQPMFFASQNFSLGSSEGVVSLCAGDLRHALRV